MSPLWGRHYIAVLGAARTALYRRDRGGVALLGAVDCGAGAAPAWHGALAALAELVAEHRVRRGSLALLLSSRFTRVIVVPWNDQIKTPDEQQAYARIRFESIYGTAAESWTLTISPEAAGRPRLAAAVAAELMEQIGQLAAAAKLRVVSVQPHLMAVFNRFARVIDEQDFLLLVAEGNSYCTVLACDGQWVQARSSLSASATALEDLLEREWQLQPLGQPNPPVIYLHAPGVAAIDTTDRHCPSPRLLTLAGAEQAGVTDAMARLVS